MKIQNETATFARPADTTQYASGDLVANSTTAGSVTPMEWNVADYDTGVAFIRRAKIKKSATSVTSASFRLHLYGASPTIANGDNSAWSTTESTYYGAIDVTVDRAFSDSSAGFGVPVTGSEINAHLRSGGKKIYGLLEARGTYTPASAETFSVTLEFWKRVP